MDSAAAANAANAAAARQRLYSTGSAAAAASRAAPAFGTRQALPPISAANASASKAVATPPKRPSVQLAKAAAVPATPRTPVASRPAAGSGTTITAPPPPPKSQPRPQPPVPPLPSTPRHKSATQAARPRANSLTAALSRPASAAASTTSSSSTLRIAASTRTTTRVPATRPSQAPPTASTSAQKSTTTTSKPRPPRPATTLPELLAAARTSEGFVYLLPTHSRDSVKSNSYDLRLASHDEIADDEFYTLSAAGVTQVSGAASSFTPLDRFEAEVKISAKLRSMRVFALFRQWKAFTVWRKAVTSARMYECAEKLDSSLFILSDTLRPALMAIRVMCLEVVNMRLVSIDSSRTYTLKEFLHAQDNQLQQAARKLVTFRTEVIGVVRRACDAAFADRSYSAYSEPDTYTEQARKRTLCQRLTSFVRLADLLVTNAMQLLCSESVGLIRQYLDNLRRAALDAGQQLQCKVDAELQQAREQLERKLASAVATSSGGGGGGRTTSAAVNPTTSNSITPPPEARNLLPLSDGTSLALRKIGEERMTRSHMTDPKGEASQTPFLQIEQIFSEADHSLVFSPDLATVQKDFSQLTSAFKKAVCGVAAMVVDESLAFVTKQALSRERDDAAADCHQLEAILNDDLVLQRDTNQLLSLLAFAYGAASTYSARLADLQQMHATATSTSIDWLASTDHSLAFFSEALAQYDHMILTGAAIVPLMQVGLLVVDCRQLKEAFMPAPRRCMQVLQTSLPNIAAAKTRHLMERMHAAVNRLEAQPSTTMEYVEALSFILSLPDMMAQIENDAHEVAELYNLVARFQIETSPEDVAEFETAKTNIVRLRDAAKAGADAMPKKVEEFSHELDKDISALGAAALKIRDDAQKDMVLDAGADMEEVLAYMAGLEERMQVLQKRAALFKSYQRQFRVEVSKFNALEETHAEIRAKSNLWLTMKEWQELEGAWTTTPFSELDAEAMTETVTRLSKTVYSLNKILPPNEVTPQLQVKIAKMKTKLPMIADLRNPALRKRHWQKIEETLGRSLPSDNSFTMALLEQLEAWKYGAVLQEVSNAASSEAALEAMLKKVEDAWKETELPVTLYRDSKDVFILAGLDDIQVLLDDSQVNIATIAGSRHVGPIKQRVDDWQKQLSLFASTLEEWTTCQRSWLYLESIFGAPDIQRQLPAESKIFSEVDKSFKEAMRRTAAFPNALRAGCTPGFLATFQKNNVLLEQIQKCLEDYLESKRMVFSRFFFLSNDELLEILSQTRNPYAVQPHMRKCFDAIQKLQFGEDNKTSVDISGMISPEGEVVSLGKGLKARGNVEVWLGFVEDAMTKSLHALTKAAMADYDARPRAEWASRHASQVVLSVSQIMWTRAVTAALSEGGAAGAALKSYEAQCRAQLAELAALARQSIPKLFRQTLGALITLDVHARDNVTALINAEVTDLQDFEWQRQLRYYWESDIDDLAVLMSNSRYVYAYEYLGASSRLVVTPLTDRCYLCLMGALQLNLGGAPAGPAGTGKTETVKDMSKAVGTQCVVFNCSDGLDFRMMGKFFSGLAQSGAWCCFDEFNRIDIEVLSVIAQQILTIRNAKAMNASRFMFEGREIRLIPKCAAFITMNPGYAGRTELPDNLKAMFRPFSMMVPDYALIAEVILFAEGFEDPHNLARKMTQMYKLCSEQLSQQDHYDFGMRAVKSVLVMAGSLKRSRLGQSEDSVLLTALRDSNLPKFLAEDVVLFEAILSDLFPGVETPQHDCGVVRQGIETCLSRRGLQRLEPQVRKIIQLHDTMVVRHGVMLVGPTGGGKTTVRSVLAEALTYLHGRATEDQEEQGLGEESSSSSSSSHFKPVHVHALNPKAVSMGELYGQVNETTMEWRDGLMAALVRQCVAAGEDQQQWIVCDGPVDALWVENLNTVLDDNKMLCLANSERIKLTPAMNMVFEVADLSMASPATVSRCGMVYVDDTEMGWQPVVQSWINQLPESIPSGIRKWLQHLFALAMPSVIAAATRQLRQVMPQVAVGKVAALCHLLQQLLINGTQETRPGQGGSEASPDTCIDWAAVAMEEQTNAAVAAAMGAQEAVAESSSTVAATTTPTNQPPASPRRPAAASRPTSSDLASQRMFTAAKTAVAHFFVFASVWAMGGNLVEDDQLEFDRVLREALASVKEIAWPASGTLFEYAVVVDPDSLAQGQDAIDADEASSESMSRAISAMSRGSDRPLSTLSVSTSAPRSAVANSTAATTTNITSLTLPVISFCFRRWEEQVPAFVFNEQLSFFDMLVPTTTTVRYSALLTFYASAHRPVLLTGPTGVGKSVIAKDALARLEARHGMAPAILNFSAQTSSRRTQDMIEAKLEKKRKNVLGAPNNRHVALFVDDLNMPKLDKFQASPPIELLRQLQDCGGFYDRDKLCFTAVQDLTLLAACAPPGGGRNPVTARLLRHFAMFAIASANQDTLKTIFTQITSSYFAHYSFSKPVVRAADAIVNSAVAIYQRMCADLLPTPAKSHYVFNLRDLSKCVQGVLQADATQLRELDQVFDLFCHEAMRVFHDRLVDAHDKSYFRGMLAEVVGKTFNRSLDTDKLATQPMLYGDFSKLGVPAEQRLYEKLDTGKLAKLLEDYLEDYNTSPVASKKPMKLVFFQDAVEHVVRIARILRQPRGNALLVGVGGTGKQSLTRLACHLAGYRCYQIEITRGYGYAEFRQDLKKLYELAGCKNEPTVFLFTDTQIVKEEFLEDINNMLNSGEVPNLFEAEELEKYLQPVRAAARAAGVAETREALFQYLVSRVRQQLHIVLCMSPVGEAFRSRCRMFPSLVNCCTIDWFTQWPREALLSVAQRYFEFVEVGSSGSGEQKEAALKGKVCEMCVEIHTSVTAMADQFYTELRRKYYTTPTSYLELIQLYTSMLDDKRRELVLQRDRFQTGLNKLKDTNSVVDAMQAELTALEPVLREKAAATAQLMSKLQVDQAAADEVRKVVKAEEAVAQREAQETEAIRADAQRDLNQALPALEAATQALDMLDKKDIQELKVFTTPPAMVQVVLEAVCVIFGRKTDWKSAKALLSEADFLKMMITFDKDNLPEKTLKKLKPYIDNPDFVPEKVDKVSKACTSMCMWVRAMELYARVYRTVAPKREKLEAAQTALNTTLSALKEKQERLLQVEEQIAVLRTQYRDSVTAKEELELKQKQTSARLERAGKLTTALATEQVRWSAMVASFDCQVKDVVGNVFLAAASVAYFGAFTSPYRKALMSGWVGKCKELCIPVSDSMALGEIMSSPYQIRQWNAAGLPRDQLSTENAVLVTCGRRWPLMIDPQDQAHSWIRHMEAKNGLKILKLSDANFLRTLENAIRTGQPVLLEEVGESLDPALEPILLKQTFKVDGRLMIRLGDADVDYDSNFRFYMTTKLPNPHYLPEICIKVTIINFTVTEAGLEDQLLADVVRLERPELEEQRSKLIVQINNDKEQLKGIEDEILRLLFQSQGNILDNEQLINTLNEAKVTSSAIASRLQQAEATEASITQAREKYRPAAVCGSLLFFAMASMSGIDPMYQNSLAYFKQLYASCIEQSEHSGELQARLDSIVDYTMKTVYNNVARGLFERHKLLFSFTLAVAFERNKGLISGAEWDFFLRGAGAGERQRPPMPVGQASLSVDMWNSAVDLETALGGVYAGLMSEVVRGPIAVKIGAEDFVVGQGEAGDHGNASVVDWRARLSSFQALLLIRHLAVEKVVAASTAFVHRTLGPAFVESPAMDMATLYNDMSPAVPLIFVLSVGSDPMSAFLRFAKEKGYADRIQSISLGQGQGPVAEKLIERATKAGDWVFLQNCHLAESWMARMEAVVKALSDPKAAIHGDFRLFLSAAPCAFFPVSVLQNSVKVTNEPPMGLRANLKRAFASVTPEFLESHRMGADWRKLVYGMCFFHAVVQERKKFGPLGWNIRHEFSASDRECGLETLRLFLQDVDSAQAVPWTALQFITGSITYGGRVTDRWDDRCLQTILRRFLVPQALEPGFTYSSSGLYKPPLVETWAQLQDYIEALPFSEAPEVFGLHSNADLALQRGEAMGLLNAILDMQPRVGGGGGGGGAGGEAEDGAETAATAKTPEEQVAEIATQIQERLPTQLLSLEDAKAGLFDTDAQGRVQSLSTVLRQEVDRFNCLLKVIWPTLENLKRALKGQLVMSDSLEKIYYSFLNNQVPAQWATAAYPSRKALGSWVRDLVQRIRFIDGWLRQGPPGSFWLSGFFFPQGFLTGALQTHARKYNLPIDTLHFKFEVLSGIYVGESEVETAGSVKGALMVLKEQQQQQQQQQEPEAAESSGGNVIDVERLQTDGVLVHGLFMEACRWDDGARRLVDAQPGQMHAPLPVLHMLPCENFEVPAADYVAPLYKTSARAGTLSTTGHSTNFVVSVHLPSAEASDYWVARGAALLCQKE